jgi:protein-disulfide isomerase-like protein with CxxC motif
LAGRPHGIFDSIFATRAIAALGAIDPTLEPALLESLQTARYVDAMETSDAAVVATIAVRVGRAHGHSIDEAVFALKLTNDEGLSRRTEARIRKTLTKMRELSESGVPQLLATFGEHREALHGGDLYGGPDAVLKALEAVRDRATVN